ncbi:hypothetical protein AArcSl_2300 [Halalkaliarchaeum desulfuricum]|uniref:Uncharacterized protein n=1 Tax=Halalkaliarchaeum desulfuricum TaxID=2055893 RepID=A0A343TLF1_9EURY|nr:hypothetical protein AArcSl_2300 [Halalkaliarchaeum desulfuricum]
MSERDDNPFLEDLAAIWTEDCEWVEILDSYTSQKHDETFYEEGAECEATRSYRFELAYIALLDEGEPEVVFQRSVIDWLKESGYDDVYDELIDIVDAVECKWYHNEDDIEAVSVDPDRSTGEFVIRLGDEYEVGYGPGVTDDA